MVRRLRSWGEALLFLSAGLRGGFGGKLGQGYLWLDQDAAAVEDGCDSLKKRLLWKRKSER